MTTLTDKLPKVLNPKALNIEPLNWSRLNQLLPPIMSLIFIIGCSYTLSQITWAFISSDVEQQAPPNNINNKTQQTANNYEEIRNAHLFGLYQQTPTSTATTEAPETRLNLVLKGLLAAMPAEFASAIISIGKNGPEETFSIGDKVSSATLKEIHADRVILQRAGKLETLRLPTDESLGLVTSSPGQYKQQSRPSSPGLVLSDIRKQIIKKPASFSKFAVPIPYKENGVLLGYRLKPQGDRALFDAVGLDPTDVIVAVNGVKLNSPRQGLKALRALKRSKSINITVLRNGAEIPLHFDVP